VHRADNLGNCHYTCREEPFCVLLPVDYDLRWAKAPPLQALASVPPISLSASVLLLRRLEAATAQRGEAKFTHQGAASAWGNRNGPLVRALNDLA
jgi:hypothetical protein